MLDTRYERGGDCAESNEENSKTPRSGRDRVGLVDNEILWFQDNPFLTGERHQRLVPLRWNPPRISPMLDSTLPLAQKVRQPALAPKAAYDSFR